MLTVKYPLSALAALIAFYSVNASAEEYFNPAFLSGDTAAVADLSRFEGGAQAPGTYRVDTYLNDTFQSRKDIQFLPASATSAVTTDDTGLIPCLTPAMLTKMRVNTQNLPALKNVKPDACLELPSVVKGSTTRFDFENLRLDISVPQAMMMNSARGYIPPSQWDEGINALMLNYNFTGSNSDDGNGSDSKDFFLGLNSGVNVGAWRLRDYSTWSYNSNRLHDKSQIQHINTWVERAIVPLRSELVMGDSTTPSDVFDSLGFRGVQLASDDNMLPDSLRGFAPTIRGIAHSHARVTIRQNSYIIYQSYVPPGAFTINDLFPTSSSGDLVVEVKESDGSLDIYTVPYSSVPVLQREGHLKYSVTAGKYRSNSDQQEEVGFAQSTAIWGLPAGFTAYGGFQAAQHYKALALGTGVNIGEFGALSFDVTQATSELADESTHRGSSLRFLYSKSLQNMGTSFQLIGYRYSTEGFYTLEDTTRKQMKGFADNDLDEEGHEHIPEAITDYYNLHNTKRDKIQLNVSQQLGTNGSLYISGSRQSYWGSDELNTLLQTGYSGNLYGVSWTLNYSYNKIPGMNDADQRVAIGISIPLSQWLFPSSDITHQSHSAYASTSISTDMRGNTTESAGINGTLLEDDNLSYSVQQGYQNNGGGSNGAVSADYNGSWGNANVGYNYSNGSGYQQVNYGMSGAVVAHRNGITLSQPLGDTNVLIAAPGAGDVKVEDSSGIRTDWRGYAIVPYATTYRMNRVALETTSLPENVDLDETVVSVVPTRGALVRAKFSTHIGARVLITLTHAGNVVPFGALVTTEDGNSSIVGDDGQVYLSGLADRGKLTVSWGKAASQQCVAQYSLVPDAASHAITKLTRACG
ncbi:fimbrial biogenesis usher protein [Rahnella woolbedingensis]|uniref:Outer membrane usher protein FimD n=1 Tax=Rahnella woolbedingensis TaxID=1510574 RepID=A0A419N223_9GAMM|nr:fimbrial biogenesis usher protein [Rahnella woolbedingensis]RJT32580.1 outer membrane usher protein FimD [Rahnella woolbedingensis]